MDRRWSAAAVLALMSCGPSIHAGEEEPTGPVVERCGTIDPVLLFRLGPDETVREATSGTVLGGVPLAMARHGDERIFVVSTVDRRIEPGAEDEPLSWRSSRVVAVDECGENPRVLLEGALSIRPPTGGEPWTACTQDQGLVAFDPDREGSVPTELPCSGDLVQGGFVVFRTLQEQHWVSWAEVSLDGPPRVFDLLPAFGPVMGTHSPDSRIMPNAEEQVVEVRLPTGEVTVLLDGGYYDWSASDDGRFVEWTVTGIENPPTLWDRESDATFALGSSEWPDYRTFGIARDAISTRPYHDVPDETELVLLPSGQRMVLAGRWGSEGRIGGTYLLQGESAVAVVSPQAPLRTIPTGAASTLWLDEDRAWLLDRDDEGPAARVRLRELAMPDFEPRDRGDDLWYPHRLRDGRIVTLTERSADGLRGTLVLVDEQGERIELDHDVAATRPQPGPLPEDTLVYEVRDPEHLRSGVYSLQLAPAGE